MTLAGERKNKIRNASIGRYTSDNFHCTHYARASIPHHDERHVVSMDRLKTSCTHLTIAWFVIVVKASVSRVADPELESRFSAGVLFLVLFFFSGASSTSDFKIGTPMFILTGAWNYRASAGAG